MMGDNYESVTRVGRLGNFNIKLQDILKHSETFNFYLLRFKGSNYIIKYRLKN